MSIKVKYIHNLNLHLVNFGINGKVIEMPFEYYNTFLNPFSTY